MHRITRRDFASTIAIVQALSGYLDVVDGVVTRDAVDIGAELSAVHSDLLTIKKTADAVAGKELGIPVFSADQLTAVTDALSLISVLIDEQRRVDDLRAIETVENRSLFDQTARSLRTANTAWLRRLETQISQRQTLTENRLEKMRWANEAKRRPVVEQLVTIVEERERLIQVEVALNEVVDKLITTHTAYLALLDNPNAELTKAERKKMAKLNHDRVMGALKSLTAVLSAF